MGQECGGVWGWCPPDRRPEKYIKRRLKCDKSVYSRPPLPSSQQDGVPKGGPREVFGDSVRRRSRPQWPCLFTAALTSRHGRMGSWHDQARACKAGSTDPTIISVLRRNSPNPHLQTLTSKGNVSRFRVGRRIVQEGANAGRTTNIQQRCKCCKAEGRTEFNRAGEPTKNHVRTSCKCSIHGDMFCCHETKKLTHP